MASPQTERGFVMVALDLFAALAVADWPKREWTVLAEMLMQVYGPQKRREAHVDPRTLEHYSGLSTKNVYRAIRNLKACGVVAENANGSFKFIKDFESWDYEAIEKVTGKPVRSRRLADGDLRFALSANDRYGRPIPINTSNKEGVQRDTASVQRDTVLSEERCPTGHRIGAETVSNGTPATIGARASEEFEIGELRGVGADACEAVSSGSVSPGTFDELLTAVAVEFKPKVTAYVKANGPDIVANVAGRFDCYLAALRTASKLREKPDNPHAWCLAVAKKYASRGIPPEPVTIEAAGGAATPTNPYTKLLAEMEDED